MNQSKRPPAKAKTPKRLTASIKKDTVNPADWLRYDFRSACEDCTHFCLTDFSCTLGYHTSHHREEKQQSDYILSGRIAQCRFLEID